MHIITKVVHSPLNDPTFLSFNPAPGMYDHNVLARLTPCDAGNNARTAFGLEQNASRFYKTAEGIAKEPIIDSREPTPPLLPPSEGDQDATDCILLTFDNPPKNPSNGWQFGTNERSSNVLLGCRGTPGVSSRQYNIIIDKKLRIWLRDFYSSRGTAVSYSDDNQDDVRKKESWILSFEPGHLKQWKEIKIRSGGLAIKVEFPNQGAGRPQYVENLRTFFNQSQIAAPVVDLLELESGRTTITPSQPLTPDKHPIYIDDRLIGRGQFGEVRKVIKARDGDFYAAKKFFPPPVDPNGNKKRKRDESNWLEKIRNEIAIMESNPHVRLSMITQL